MTDAVVSFERKFVENIRVNHLIPSGEKILVAFSGGVDSTVLLTCMVRTSSLLGVTVCAAHFNHMLRGEEADRDERFCAETAGKLAVCFYAGRGDVRMESRVSGKGLEETARDLRYKFLNETAESSKCKWILTAHNSDDNAETVLFHIIRGCSVKGLRGIPVVRGNIVRPLLPFTRAEIEAYARALNLIWVTDSTNFSSEYARNYIRNVILPEMRHINPAVSKALLRLSQNALVHDPRSDILVSQYAGVSQKQLSKTNIDDMLSALDSGRTGRLSLPGGVDFVYSCGKWNFSVTKSDEVSGFEETELKKGRNFLGECLVCVDPKCDGCEIRTDCESAKFCWEYYVTQGLDLTARTRMPGDKFVSGGMTRNVKKCHINNKIERSLRGALPVITDDEGIVCVAGVGVSDRAKPREPGATRIRIHIRKAGPIE